MTRAGLTAVLLAALLVTGCEDEQQASMPAPYALTAEAMGRYCGMDVLEHAGPKGQVILDQIPEPIWFSSAHDAIAFTMLPEEPKDIAAIYVSDMGKAPSWEKPGPENFIDARTAFYGHRQFAARRHGGTGGRALFEQGRRRCFCGQKRRPGGSVRRHASGLHPRQRRHTSGPRLKTRTVQSGREGTRTWLRQSIAAGRFASWLLQQGCRS